MSDQLETALAYCEAHPEAKDIIIRAAYAYHMEPHELFSHNFSGQERNATCYLCGQSREGVRWNWYNKSPRCEGRSIKERPDICGIISTEEKKFSKTLERADKISASMDVNTVTGEELAVIHHTHGVPLSVLEDALSCEGKKLPFSVVADYEAAYGKFCAQGKNGLVRQIIVAK